MVWQEQKINIPDRAAGLPGNLIPAGTFPAGPMGFIGALIKNQADEPAGKGQ
jgi:hypothetical protein